MYGIMLLHSVLLAVTPLPFVVVTLGARWQYYGVKDTDENLKLYASSWLLYNITPIKVTMMMEAGTIM